MNKILDGKILSQKIKDDLKLEVAELKKQGITPLRWAIVKIGNDFFTINVAYDKIAMG